MRVLVKNELNLNKPINLRRLSPRLKIYAGIMTKIRETKIYQTAQHRRMEQEYIAQVKKDEKLKEILLAQIYKELVNNATLQKKNAVCETIFVDVDWYYKDSLIRILSHSDFLPYKIRQVVENKDIRKAYHDMPIILRVEKKVL